MIAVWMLYCVGIGLAFVVVGQALERGLHLAGRPTRWAWVVALVGTYLIPVAAWLRPEAFATFEPPIPLASPSGPSLPTSTTSTNLDQPPPSALSLSDLDAPLRWAWGIGSVAMLLMLVTAATRLIALRRAWRRATVDGREILISSNVGPAVVGFWSPRVVLPEWAFQLSDGDRELMLAHEEQHVRAKDPALLAAALAAVFVAPWNLALWWHWRRLRLAVEIDCDARVLAEGRSAPEYGELLLRVGRRRGAQMLGVAAFGEPVSFLESRIRRMLAVMPRWRWAGAALATTIAAGALVGACETPRPLAPATTETALSARRARAMTDRMQIREAERLRPWVEENARRMFPSILEPSGPPMDAFLIHDSRLHVYRGSLTTLHYLGSNGTRPNHEIDLAELQQVLPSFSLGDGWAVVDPRGLRGLVRDNVRLIRINHDPEPQDTAMSSRGLSEQEMNQGAEQLRRLARQFHPEMFGQSGSRSSVALVLNANGQVVAHAASATEPVGAVNCLDALTHLVPQYTSARWSRTGCTIERQSKVVIFWGQLLNQ